jgi:hypothetical protein
MIGAFGISNYVTGVMLILLGWKARPLALAMPGVLPVAYTAQICVMWLWRKDESSHPKPTGIKITMAHRGAVCCGSWRHDLGDPMGHLCPTTAAGSD